MHCRPPVQISRMGRIPPATTPRPALWIWDYPTVIKKTAKFVQKYSTADNHVCRLFLKQTNQQH